MQGLRLVACTLLAVVLGCAVAGCGAEASPPALPAVPSASASAVPSASASAVPSASASAPGAATASPASPAPGEAPKAWVAVSVATLWVEPGLARAIDAPACAAPADPAGWASRV